MHNILFPICNIVFNEATRLATEAICSSHKGIVRLILKKKKEKKKNSLKLLLCIHTKLAWMHIFMYSLAHCGISGFKMYGTSHLKCSSSCVWAIKQQWRGGGKSFGQVRTDAGLGLRQTSWSFDTFWVICLCSFWQVCLRLPSLHKKARKKRGWEWLYSNYSIHTGEKMTSNFRDSHKEAWISASTRAFVQRVTW